MMGHLLTKLYRFIGTGIVDDYENSENERYTKKDFDQRRETIICPYIQTHIQIPNN